MTRLELDWNYAEQEKLKDTGGNLYSALDVI